MCIEIAQDGDFGGPLFGRNASIPISGGGYGGSGGGIISQRYTDNSNPTDSSALNAIRKGAKWIRQRGKLKSDTALEAIGPDYDPMVHAHVWSPEEIKKMHKAIGYNPNKQSLISRLKNLFKKSK